MPTLESILKALTLAGSATPAAVALVDAVKDIFDDEDKATLDEAIADVQAENDEGHARLQAKLKAAAGR